MHCPSLFSCFACFHRFCFYPLPGIIAGGTKAIQSSIEGAEDSIEDGIASIIDKDVCDKDVVLGECCTFKLAIFLKPFLFF